MCTGSGTSSIVDAPGAPPRSTAGPPPLQELLAIATTPPPKRHPYNQWAPDARALDLVGDKWTLLIVRDLAGGPRRFVELQRVLPGISTEQLRSRLNRMVADGLLTRQRYREVPPRVDYELTERSRDLLPVVGALARWGYRWAWGPPRPGEAIDVGAILRCARASPRRSGCGARSSCGSPTAGLGRARPARRGPERRLRGAQRARGRCPHRGARARVGRGLRARCLATELEISGDPRRRRAPARLPRRRRRARGGGRLSAPYRAPDGASRCDR